ncbi:MFS transporter [Brevibacillus sp. TJ4]|uniref:MFS transporter n=1 Tax=Brevibacillus sp. TJ4 TaxID=3234853 RepID=UPI003BA38886
MLSKNMRWVYITIPIFFFWFFGQIDKLGISVIQTDPGFLADMGLTGPDKNAKLGFLTFIFTVSYALSNLFWGVIIDKLGARKTAMLGISVWGLTMIMAGMSTSYEMFVVSRIILGIGEGIMIPISGKFIANWFNRKEIGKAQASWISGNYLGPALGALVLTLLIANVHWEYAFYLLAACNLLLNIPMFYFLTRERPEEHPGMSKEEIAYIRQNDEPSDAPKQRFTQDYRYWMVWVGMLASSFLFFGISIWLPTYLTQGKGFAVEEMAGITSLSWLFALFFVLICGYLSDKTQRPSLLASMMFGMSAIFLLIASNSTNPIVAGVSLGLAMGTQGGVFHLSNLFIVKFSTPETAGRAAGLMGFTNILGGFASYIMGWMRDASGGDFGPSILMLIGVALIGFIAYVTTLKKEASEVRLYKQA